jgi:hypothetical protein
MTSEEKLFDPARMPARDDEGKAWHPDFDDRWEHPVFGEEYVCTLKLAQAGFAFAFHHMDPNDADFDRACENSDFSMWTPRDMSAEGWWIVGIGDTEDGPCAWYVRPVEGEAQAALIAREREALDKLQDPRSNTGHH